MGRSAIPSPAEVSTAAAAVLFLGRCLDYDESPVSLAGLRRQLAGDRIDWMMVVDVANRHRVTTALWSSLSRKGLARLPPTDVQEYLQMLHALNRRRNRLIFEQACQATSALNERGLRPVLMKGGLWLFEPAWDSGSRLMTDIDMLLPENLIADGAAALRALGYFTLGGSPPHAHAWTFYRPMSLVTIDLHRHIGPQRDLLPADAAQVAAAPLSAGTMALDGLCPTDRALLLMLTFGIFERGYAGGQISLRGLYDLAALCARHGPAIDWQAIAGKAKAHGLTRLARAWLHMAHCILGVPAPAVLHPTAAARLHLRRCMLQLAFPAAEELARRLTFMVWPFNRFRMDYRYGCGRKGMALNLARFRHATGVLARRGPLFGPQPVRAAIRRMGGPS